LIGIRKKAKQQEYPNKLKSWEFGKETAQILKSGASDIVLEQGASEDSKFVAKPTMPKTNFSNCLGIGAEKFWI